MPGREMEERDSTFFIYKMIEKMKMMKRTLLMAAAVAALAACSDDDGPEGPQIVTETVTFEEATLNASGILTGANLAETVSGDAGTYKEYDGVFYTSGASSFLCYYSDQWDTAYSAGFTVSNNTNMETPGSANQFSVYAKSGANDSKKFAVGYYDAWNASQGKAGAVPTVTFAKKVNPLSVWVNNNTYAYRWWVLGESGYGTTGIPAKVDALLTMKGYADGALKREVTFKLVDAKKGLVVDKWTNVDLTPLGWVDKIEFCYVCENDLAPSYFCIDDLSVATELNY